MNRPDLLAAVFGAALGVTAGQARILAHLYVRQDPLHWEILRMRVGCSSKDTLETQAAKARKIIGAGILCRDQMYRLTDSGRARLAAILDEARGLL